MCKKDEMLYVLDFQNYQTCYLASANDNGVYAATSKLGKWLEKKSLPVHLFILNKTFKYLGIYSCTVVYFLKHAALRFFVLQPMMTQHQ